MGWWNDPHEKAIWPKCHFRTLRPVSWTREVLSTASEPSKGERVMVGNGSRAVAGQFIDRMDLTLSLTLSNGKQQKVQYGTQVRVACDTRLESASNLLSYERDSLNFIPVKCARDKKCNSRTLLSLINDSLLVDHIDRASNDSSVRNCL